MHTGRIPQFFRRTPNPHITILAIIGLLLVFLIPPFQSPDEQTHLYRAYEISQGHLFAHHLSYGAGDVLPASLSQSFNDYFYLIFKPDNKVHRDVVSRSLHMPLDTHKTAETRFENTAIYPPVAYIPQVVGILVGRLFSASPVMLLYLARIANLAAWLGLLWFSMRRNRQLVVPLFVFALIPVVAFQASSASADVMTAGLSIAFALEAFRLATSREIITWKKHSVLLGLGLLLSLCKFPYAFLSLLVFIVPFTRFATTREAWGMRAATLGAALLPSLAWLTYSQKAFVNLRIGADRATQLHSIITAPWSYLHVLYNTYISLPSDGLYLQMIGQLGWLDTKLPMWALLSGAFALLLALISVPRLPAANGLRRFGIWWTALVGIMLVGLISTALYLTWNPPHAPVIEGLQGRYYIPLFGVITILATGFLGLKTDQFVRAKRLAYTLSGFCMGAMIVVLLLRYYPL